MCDHVSQQSEMLYLLEFHLHGSLLDGVTDAYSSWLWCIALSVSCVHIYRAYFIMKLSS